MKSERMRNYITLSSKQVIKCINFRAQMGLKKLETSETKEARLVKNRDTFRKKRQIKPSWLDLKNSRSQEKNVKL
jgi:hypothetical protein